MADNYDDEQLSIEIEALEVTFGEQLNIEKNADASLKITLTACPCSGDNSTIEFVQATIQIDVPVGYPAISPSVVLVMERGLGEKRASGLIACLLSEISALEGELLLGHLCSLALDYITDNNFPKGDCTFCLEAMDRESDGCGCSVSESALCLPCYHAFHRSCFWRWWHFSQADIAMREQRLAEHTGQTAAVKLQAAKDASGAYVLACPVCRMPFSTTDVPPEVADGSASMKINCPGSNPTPPPALSELLDSETLEALRQRQAIWASMLERQRSQGGVVTETSYSISSWQAPGRQASTSSAVETLEESDDLMFQNQLCDSCGTMSGAGQFQTQSDDSCATISEGTAEHRFDAQSDNSYRNVNHTRDGGPNGSTSISGEDVSSPHRNDYRGQMRGHAVDSGSPSLERERRAQGNCQKAGFSGRGLKDSCRDGHVGRRSIQGRAHSSAVLAQQQHLQQNGAVETTIQSPTSTVASVEVRSTNDRLTSRELKAAFRGGHRTTQHRSHTSAVPALQRELEHNAAAESGIPTLASTVGDAADSSVNDRSGETTNRTVESLSSDSEVHVCANEAIYRTGRALAGPKAVHPTQGRKNRGRGREGRGRHPSTSAAVVCEIESHH